MSCLQIFFDYYYDMFVSVLLAAMVSHIFISINYYIVHHSIQKRH